MRKGDEIFSKDEFAMLQAFTKNAAIEDRRLHGIQDNNNRNNTNNNNPNVQPIQQVRQNQIPVKKPEPPKPVTTAKPPPIKKEEKPIKKEEPQKPKPPPIKKEEKKEPPKPNKKTENPQQAKLTGLPPKIEYVSPQTPPPPMEGPKQEVIKMPPNAKIHYANNEPPKESIKQNTDRKSVV